jgi:hypothetical protein
MNTKDMTLTYHCSHEKIDRMVAIATNLEFGEIILEHQIPGTEKKECLTSTGILMVKALAKEILITMYVPNVDKVIALFKEVGKPMPRGYTKLIKANRKKVGAQ